MCCSINIFSNRNYRLNNWAILCHQTVYVFTTRWQADINDRNGNFLWNREMLLSVLPFLVCFFCVDFNTAWWKCWAKTSGVHLSQGWLLPVCNSLSSSFLVLFWCFLFGSTSIISALLLETSGGGTLVTCSVFFMYGGEGLGDSGYICLFVRQEEEPPKNKTQIIREDCSSPD